MNFAGLDWIFPNKADLSLCRFCPGLPSGLLMLARLPISFNPPT